MNCVQVPDSTSSYQDADLPYSAISTDGVMQVQACLQSSVGGVSLNRGIATTDRPEMVACSIESYQLKMGQ